MNESGWLREIMSRKMDVEAFFECVMESVEKELSKWGHDVVLVYDWQSDSDDMNVMLILDGSMVRFDVSKKEVESRQSASPFSVDKLVWTDIKKTGIDLKDSPYMRYVWM